MKTITSFVILFAGLAGVSCQPKATNPEIEVLKKEVVDSYADLAFTIYGDSYGNAGVMAKKIDEFLANPSAESLLASQQAWAFSRQIYAPTEVFRFYGGPIDGSDSLGGYLNGWPLNPAYVDYTTENRAGGIVNDVQTYPVISKEVLRRLNRKDDPTNISTGWHVIEILLFGGVVEANRVSSRSFTDYTSAPNAVRRRQYLQVATELLLEDLAKVREGWKPGAAYRSRFVDEPNTAQSLTKIFRGMIALSRSELSERQLAKPLASRNPLDTQSPFSGIGAWDVVYSLKGIRSVYTGSYGAFDRGVVVETSLSYVLRRNYPASDQAIMAQLAETAKHVQELTNPRPLASLIQNDSNGKVAKAIESLQKLSDRLADAAVKLNVQTD